MPRKQQERAISGVRYRVTQFGALTGGEFLFRVGTPLLGLAAGTLGSKKPLSAGAISLLTSQLKPEDFSWALSQFATCTQVQIVDTHGAPHPRTGERKATWVELEGIYDDHFAGDYGAMLEWLKFCAEVNFASFFVGLGENAAPEARAATPPSTSPPSDGGTGDSSPAPDSASATS